MHFQQGNTFSGWTDPILDTLSPDYKAVVLRVGTGVDIDYLILSSTGVQWEVGVGQLGVGGVITRDTVTDNHLSTTAKVDFDLGRHVVFVFEQGGGSLTLDAIPAPVASVNFAQQQATQFRIENRTSDPGAPADGEIWLRVDL